MNKIIYLYMEKYLTDIKNEIENLISLQNYYANLEDFERCYEIESEIDRLSDLLI